ncbi:MAG: TRAP transporter large permease [Aurantimonas endophytica]|uniref:TRAP transporter large permease n=1 Tax=Aurantimonas endophytica TaxID=1522175 RepID=UPI003001A5C6
MSLLLLTGLMIGLAVLGVPLVFALLASSIVTLVITRPELPLAVVPQLFTQGIDSFALIAIVLFFLAGELMSAGGVTERILAFARALVGHLRGGLAQVGIFGSVIMSGISGSAVADAAAIGPLLIRSMKAAGYPAGFSAALMGSASILAPILPPSIPMIIYAVISGSSVGAMFLAGVVPGFLIAASLSVIAYFRARQLDLPREPRATGREIRTASGRAIFALLAPVMIVVGIRGGIFTVTEAAAVIVLYVLAISIFVFRGLKLSDITQALVRATHGTASIMVILGASSIFAWIIADQGAGRAFAGYFQMLGAPDWGMLLLINLLFLVVGMFLDPLAALIILVPIFLPLATELGMDSVQFGVMIVLNLMIGLMTPPVGFLIFMTASMGEVSPGAVIRQSLPFIVALLAVLAVVTFVPAATLWLPSLFSGK